MTGERGGDVFPSETRQARSPVRSGGSCCVSSMWRFRSCTTVGDPESDEAIHDARRRVKKIRAVIRLVRPVLDKPYRAVDAICRTSAGCSRRSPTARASSRRSISSRTATASCCRDACVTSIRAGLRRARRSESTRPSSDRVLSDRGRDPARRAPARQALAASRRRLSTAVAPGLEESFRRARDAMILAWSQPKADHYHAWRRYVKDHWFHVRLLEAAAAISCSRTSAGSRRSTACWASTTTSSLLREVLVSDSYTVARETARCLRVVSRYQRLLRHHAQSLGVADLRREAAPISCGASSGSGRAATPSMPRTPRARHERRTPSASATCCVRTGSC